MEPVDDRLQVRATARGKHRNSEYGIRRTHPVILPHPS
jgi:hypothetical protein